MSGQTVQGAAMDKTLATRDFHIFTALLRDTRKQAGVTQVQLAEILKQTQSYISKVERGECRLDLVQIRTWCHALGTTLPEFVAEFERRVGLKKR